MEPIRVMVVDDHEVVRTGLKAILDPEEDIRVVAEAGSAGEAVERARELNPQVVLMDVRMQGVDGIVACRLIKSELPETNVLMFTSFGDEEAVMSAIMAGASGYLLKNMGRSDLLAAIRAASAGQNLLDPAVTKAVIDRLTRLAEKEQDRAVEAISQREKEVLVLLAQGLTNREIAQRLVISDNTVRNHVSRILEKLDLARHSEAAAFAAQHGLLDEEKQPRP